MRVTRVFIFEIFASIHILFKTGSSEMFFSHWNRNCRHTLNGIYILRAFIDFFSLVARNRNDILFRNRSSQKKFVFLSMPFHHLQSRACVSLYFRFAWVIGNAGAIETEARAKAGQVKQLNGICGLCTCRQIIPCKLWINLKQTDEPYTRICAWCWWHNENRQFRRLNGIFDKIPIRNFLSPILFLGKAIIEKLNKYSITSTLYMTISCKQI